MRTVLIDDEVYAMNELKYYLSNLETDYQIELVNTYINPLSALDSILSDQPDVIFVDMDMPVINGLSVAKKYQELLPNIIIVFVTAHSNYALEAYQVHPIDYLLKPLRKELLDQTMQVVTKQHRILSLSNLDKSYGQNIRVKCFGKFEVTNDKGIVMKFITKKSKELFSYMLCCIDKPIYRNEVLDIFYGNADTTKALNNYYVTLHRLRSAIGNFGFHKNEIEIKENCEIFIKDGICDFIDFIRMFRGNYPVDENNFEKCCYLINSYEGELFGGIDKEWVNDMREWVDIQMEELMIKTSTYLINRKNYEKAEVILQRLIKTNPYTVLGYESLLDLYLLLQRIESFQLLYKKYIKIMKEELGLDDEFIKKYTNKSLIK